MAARFCPLNGHCREDRATAKKGDDLARRYVAPTARTLATIGHRARVRAEEVKPVSGEPPPSQAGSPDARDHPEAPPARVVGVALQPCRQHRLLAQRPGGQQGTNRPSHASPHSEPSISGAPTIRNRAKAYIGCRTSAYGPLLITVCPRSAWS